MGSWVEKARHCPLCGTQLVRELIERRVRATCKRCDFVLYAAPGVASAVIILEGREILFVKRSIEPYKDHWGFPAGYQEYEEPPEETARRECKEETGLEVEILALYDILYTMDDPRKSANRAVYFARVRGGQARAGSDASELAWFSIDALPEKIAFENNRKILEDLRRQYPDGPIAPEIQAQDGRE